MTSDISTECSVQVRWQMPPETLELTPAEVHVWRVSMPTQRDRLDRFRDILSEEERRKADQFKFDKDRDSYTTTRAVLRELLAKYTESAPESLSFVTNEHGKPALPNGRNLQNIQFNVSHSGTFALLAFGQQHPIGVDVERIRPDVTEISRLLLSSRENQSYKRLSEAQRLASLFHVWTSKEAIIKALGKGFSIPLKDVEVEIHPENPRSLVRLSAQIGNAEDWKLYGLTVDEQYSAAIAVGSEIRQVSGWNWS